MRALLVGLALSGAVLTGCTSETLMELRLENITPAGAAGAPTKAEVKLVAVTVYYEAPNELVKPELVAYVSPDCGGKIDCDLPRVNTYFDLALTTAALSTYVGSQRLAVKPEKVNRARLYFCRTSGLGLPNGRFLAPGMTTPHEYIATNCSVVGRAIEPEAELLVDNIATLTLQYDLTGSVKTPGTGAECEPSASNLCYHFPTFTPFIGQRRQNVDNSDRDRDGASN